MDDAGKPEESNSFKDVLKKLAEDSSLHGVPKIVSSRQIPVKILWCMLFLTTFVVLMIQIYNLFVTFQAYPIQTSVSLEFSPLSFPAITLCNMNPVRKTEVNMSQPIKDIIYPRVKRKQDDGSTRKKREVAENINQRQHGQVKQASQTRKRTERVLKEEIKPELDETNFMDIEDLFHDQEELMRRIRRGVNSPTMASSTVAVSSVDSSIEPSISSSEMIQSSSQDNQVSTISPSLSSSQIDSSSISAPNPTGSNSIGPSQPSSSYYSGSSSYYYEYDYWGNFWNDYSYSTSYYQDSYYQEWAEWYSRYYSSIYNYNDYYDDQTYSTGYENFLFDQYFSQKDKWDERIINFQTVFKNESIPTRQKMGHKKEDVIVGATFVRSVQNISNFHEFTTPEYGNCYTMTSPKYKAWRSGPVHGIKLTLNLEVNEYIENFATGYGIRVVFHAPGTYPLASEEGLTLSPGYETSVGLRMVQITRLGQPYGECSDGKKFFRQYGIHYSTAACMQFCRVRKAIEVCKCIPHDSPDVDFHTDVHVCRNSGSDWSKLKKNADGNENGYKLCTIQVDVKFDDGSYQAECDCKSPCHEIVYEKTMSGRRWPNDDYLKNVLLSNACSMNISSLTEACGHLQNNTFTFEMSEKYRNNFLQVLIYFEDLNYESISQEPLYESVRFLSDIGGAMGLFMGASLLSFVEFLQLGLEICLFSWKKFMAWQQISPNHHESYSSTDKSGIKSPVSLIHESDINMEK